MAEAYAIDRRGPRLGWLLALVGGVSGTVLIAGILVLALGTVRHIEATISRQARTDASRGAEFVRDRLTKALKQQSPSSLDLAAAGGDWLQPSLQETVAEDSRLGYAMVVTSDARILAHSDPRQVHVQLPRAWLESVAPRNANVVGETELNSPFGQGRVLDFSSPVMLGSSVLGTVHVGVRLDRLEQQKEQAQRFVPAVLTVTGLLGVLILTVALLISWAAVSRARRQTQKLMRQQHQAEVGNLASGLVHEIRNPLNAMRMQAAVIRRRLNAASSPPDLQVAATTLDRLEGEVLRLQKLADDFLAYGRPGTDMDKVFALRPFLQEIVTFLTPEFERAGMQVTCEADQDADGLQVRMDRGKLRQVILNLAANAQQAMARGGRLTIGLSRPNAREASVRVSDTGTGISPEKLNQIFDLFYTTKPGGSGLGLAIVKQIIEYAGGQIRVQSNVGQGTCFDITLPLVQSRNARNLGNLRK